MLSILVHAAEALVCWMFDFGATPASNMGHPQPQYMDGLLHVEIPNSNSCYRLVDLQTISNLHRHLFRTLLPNLKTHLKTWKNGSFN
jgi:hypothetical protein